MRHDDSWLWHGCRCGGTVVHRLRELQDTDANELKPERQMAGKLPGKGMSVPFMSFSMGQHM